MASFMQDATEKSGNNSNNANTKSPGIINNAEKAQEKTKSRSDSHSSPPVGTITPSNTPQQAMTPQNHHGKAVNSSTVNSDGMSQLSPALVSERLSQLANNTDNDADDEEDEKDGEKGAYALWPSRNDATRYAAGARNEIRASD